MINFIGLPGRMKSRVWREDESKQTVTPAGSGVLSCRTRLTTQQKEDSSIDIFNVEILGSIDAPGDNHHTIVQVLIDDITDIAQNSKPVYAKTKAWRMPDSPVFRYEAELGRLPNRHTILSDWTSVAQIDSDQLIFAHRGYRVLQFTTSIVSGEDRGELACATYDFGYENSSFGYVDLQQNEQRTKTLAIALAFVVSAVDNKLYKCEIELIKRWAGKNFDLSNASGKARRKLKRALNKSVCFFREGNQLDALQICREIVEITAVSQRYDVLELCLNVARANGSAAPEELSLLKDLAAWLKVDRNRFHAMMEKILPVTIHQVKDVETALCLDSEMTQDETHHLLNNEYGKWNARVTNSDPEIRRQADYMLNIIAQARSQYVK